MSREELLRTFHESERFLKNLSQNGPERIAKKRSVKKYKNMSKEELLISLLKSEQSIAELRKSKCNSLGIEEIKKKLMC